MRKIRNTCLACLLLLFHPFLTAQLIHGVIYSNRDMKPIPFASVSVEGSKIGTISNEEGKFQLNTAKLGDEFVLVVSSIGYEPKRISQSKKGDQSPLSIFLDEGSIELKEFTTETLSAESILNKFYDAYETNYSYQSSISQAYYVSTLFEDNIGKRFLESTVEISAFSRKKERSFQVQVIQCRKSNDYRNEKWPEMNNYLYEAIKSNPILNLTDFLNPKNRKNYTLKRRSNTTFNKSLVYVIEFKPKIKAKDPLYSALAYFNSTDFALIKAEYTFLNHDSKIKNQKLKDRTYHIPYISGAIQYHKSDSIYAPKYLSYTNGWTIINNATNDTIVRDELTNEVLFIETTINRSAGLSNPLSKWGDIFEKPFPYNAKYWSSQTKVPYSNLLERAIDDLDQRQSIDVQYFNNSSGIELGNDLKWSPVNQVDSILLVYEHAGLFNGVALITKEDKIIHHSAYGYSNLADSIKLDTASIFDIGSIAKQFTTALIFKLIEQGKLDLEDSIGSYLNNYKHGDVITINELLTHRSGIPSFDLQDDNYSETTWFKSELPLNDLIVAFCSGDLEFEPNTRMEYSNSNFIILAAIIEKVEGADFFSILEKDLIEPLELKDTYSAITTPNDKRATGYVSENNKLVPEPHWAKMNMKGSGGIYSTSSDLLKWIKAYSSAGYLQEKDVSLIKSRRSYYEFYDSDFGYSWAINTNMFNTDQQTYFYGGTSLGFFSMITTIPEKGINIILLGNNGSFPRIDITKQILQLLITP